jgi:HD superfamily phosphohydrolase
MIIRDPLYGKFALPSYLSRLVMTPEVRRLSQVRLLNTLTPSLATLGELRRFSHTLGVLYLCERNGATGFSDEERRALAASVLLHDIGTPPFGHLMEYHLREHSNWSHESIIRAVLRGTHAPENRTHQIFGRRSLEFRNELRKLGISLEMVEAIVGGEHPLSLLLFGTLDLDNLDNVARMTRALGIGGGAELALRLAAALSVTRDRQLCLDEDFKNQTVGKWAELRLQAYDAIVFDPPTVAAQAVLSEAIETAMLRGAITEDDWHLSDEELLERLMQCSETKDSIILEYLGRLPSMVLCVQIAGTLTECGFSSRSQAKNTLEAVLHSEFESQRVLGYVFIDSGTFSKKLRFLCPKTDREWEIGQTSNSVIFYGFARGSKSVPPNRRKRAVESLLTKLNLTSERLVRCDLSDPSEPVDEPQRSFNLASA